MPLRSVSVLVRIRRSSSASSRPSRTAAAVRNAATRCEGSRARSRRKAILRSAAAGGSGSVSSSPSSGLAFLGLLRGLLLGLGRALAGLLVALLGRLGGELGGPPRPVADGRLALRVDGGEQQPAQQAGVLEEVARSGRSARSGPRAPRSGARPAWSARWTPTSTSAVSRGDLLSANSEPAATFTAASTLTHCSTSLGTCTGSCLSAVSAIFSTTGAAPGTRSCGLRSVLIAP